MAEGQATKGGKKNRKFGRATRSPAMKRYHAERRDQTNKAKRIARHQRQQARKHAKLMMRAARSVHTVTRSE